MSNSNSSEVSAGKVQSSVAKSVLQDFLPSTHKLEMNEKIRVLSLLSTQGSHILAQQQFTKNEWNILLVLLASHPHYASYEVLLASLTSLSFDDCHKNLEDAQNRGSKMLKKELKPVHRALSGIRIKLYDLYPCLKISLIRGAGYAITAST